jgi:hypothetical protein
MSQDTSEINRGANVDKEIVRRIVDEAHGEEANLIVWDRRDTFTIEPKAEISAEDEYLRVPPAAPARDSARPSARPR